MSSWGDPKSKIHSYSFLTDSLCNHLFYELHVTDTHKLINASDQTGFTPSPRDTWTCGVEELLFTSFFYYDTITDGLKTDWMGVFKQGYIFLSVILEVFILVDFEVTVFVLWGYKNNGEWKLLFTESLIIQRVCWPAHTFFLFHCIKYMSLIIFHITLKTFVIKH